MLLKKGITGFNSSSNVSNNDIKKIVENINSKSNYIVKENIYPKYDSNFYRLKIFDNTKYQNIDILINAQYPLYSAVSSESSWMNLSFIDIETDLQNSFENFKYLSPQILNSPITENDLRQLNKVEIDQVKYWESKTFGEIIFNNYD